MSCSSTCELCFWQLNLKANVLKISLNTRRGARQLSHGQFHRSPLHRGKQRGLHCFSCNTVVTDASDREDTDISADTGRKSSLI